LFEGRDSLDCQVHPKFLQGRMGFARALFWPTSRVIQERIDLTVCHS
jgi:hypothetical protein